MICLDDQYLLFYGKQEFVCVLQTYVMPNVNISYSTV